jgi:hypothetical protein
MGKVTEVYETCDFCNKRRRELDYTPAFNDVWNWIRFVIEEENGPTYIACGECSNTVTISDVRDKAQSGS